MIKRYKVIAVTSLSSAALLFVWICWPIMARLMSNASDLQSLGQFGDMFGSINALFSVITLSGLIYSIASQRLEQNRDEKARAMIALYELHTTVRHHEITQKAWRVLHRCITSKNYCDFVVSTFFVTKYKLPRLSSDIIDFLKTHPTTKGLSDDDIIQTENDERHKLTDAMNFFNIISLRESPEDLFRRCEFYYDWWRPLLWWLWDLIEAQYAQLTTEEKKVTIKPQWDSMLTELDRRYKMPALQTPLERYNAFCEHPLIKAHGLDKGHKCPGTK